MPNLRRLGFTLYKPFKGNKILYRIGKAIYHALSNSGGFPKENKKTIEEPSLLIRINADFSDEGYKNLVKLIKKYNIRPVIAIKMEELENPKNVIYAKNLKKLGCEFAVHGYHHNTRLPLLD